MPSDLDLAYLAGFIDADGFVTITRSVRDGRSYYAPRLGIAGTDRTALDLAASWWGANVWTHVPDNPRHRIQYGWSADGRRAYAALTVLEPFLRQKRDRAAQAIALWEHLEWGRLAAAYPWQTPGWDPTAATEEMFAAMREMNHPEPRQCAAT